MGSMMTRSQCCFCKATVDEWTIKSNSRSQPHSVPHSAPQSMSPKTTTSENQKTQLYRGISQAYLSSSPKYNTRQCDIRSVPERNDRPARIANSWFTYPRTF